MNADTSCPACNESKTVLQRRKYGVTALYLCPSCQVMFRVPKTSPEESEEFYQSDYAQGFTTDCPPPEELARMKSNSFAGTEKDYSAYIEVMQAAQLKPGSSIFDFGCSWGYGSWQLSRAGYRVFSSEVSAPRARYAVEKLDCKLYAVDELPEKVDCLFAAHVIEHLPNPRLIWELARDVLKSSGKVILFLPNGDPAREKTYPNYHKLWGLVHPLLLSPLALTHMGERYGFSVRCYSSPFNLQEITRRVNGKTDGHELLVVATR
jgi:SAM-dependent methyltransferase